MKKLLGIVVLGLLLIGNAYSMTQNQMLIIQQTLNVDQGKVTKQMHTDFWKDVPNDVVKFMETTGLMAKITRDGMQYQMELWKSALISYRNKQIYKSDDYLKIKETVNDFINRLSKNIPDANERAQVVNQMKTSMINSDNLLKSAAARTSMQSVQGPIIELSEERITFVINNIEKSFYRIDKLLQSEWKDTEKKVNKYDALKNHENPTFSDILLQEDRILSDRDFKIIEIFNKLTNNFNICDIQSSLGPSCKDNNFDSSKYFLNSFIYVENETLHFEFDDWDYYFDIIEISDKEAIIKFEDKAKHASYHAIGMIKFKYNKFKSKWFVHSTKTIYPKSEADNNFVLISK